MCSPQSRSARVSVAGAAGMAAGGAAVVTEPECEPLGAAPAAVQDAVAAEPPTRLASTAAAAAVPAAAPRHEEGAATERRHSHLSKGSPQPLNLSVTRAVDVCGWLVAASSLVVGAGLLRQLLVARSR